jgi:ATP-binding cassette, subfamily G (WHITE), member 2, PDR
MASHGDREFQPIRTENILKQERSTEQSNDDELAERPSMLPTSSSMDVEEKPELERTQTSKSALERRQFEPIRSGDREELHRIASSFSGSVALVRSMTVESTRTGLERKDTLAGIELGDAVLDPSSPEFDVYKWSRM